MHALVASSLLALTLGSSIDVGADVPGVVAARVRSRTVDGTIAIGDVPQTRALITASEVRGLRDESFIVRAGSVD